MSTFQYEKGKQYLMPVTFGSAVSPRQDQFGKRFSTENPIQQESQTVVFESDRDQLEAIIPPGFEVHMPYVIVNFDRLNDVYWLAGKSYALVYVMIPCRYVGKVDNFVGFYNTVMWEGHPDPLVTGRDQIAMNKLCGDITYFKTEGSKMHGSISNWGFEFMEMDLDLSQEPEDKETLMKILTDPENVGIFNYRYLTNCDKPDEPDVEYATLTPQVIRDNISWNPPPDYDPAKIPAPVMQVCRGTVTWHIPRWEDMPCQDKIVKKLGGLTVKRYIGAVKTLKYNPNDFLYTRKLR